MYNKLMEMIEEGGMDMDTTKKISRSKTACKEVICIEPSRHEAVMCFDKAEMLVRTRKGRDCLTWAGELRQQLASFNYVWFVKRVFPEKLTIQQIEHIRAVERKDENKYWKQQTRALWQTLVDVPKEERKIIKDFLIRRLTPCSADFTYISPTRTRKAMLKNMAVALSFCLRQFKSIPRKEKQKRLREEKFRKQLLRKKLLRKKKRLRRLR